MSEAEDSAKHWEKLADEQLKLAAWIEEDPDRRGGSTATHHHRAQLYKRAAESIRITEKTGEQHCVCHLLPQSKWPETHPARR